MSRRRWRWSLAPGLALGVATHLCGGCSASHGGEESLVFAGLEAAARESSLQPGGEGAPALVEGRAVEWRELRPLLAEAAGAAVLEEVVLDHLLERQLQRQGLGVGDAEVRRERDLLLATIAGEGAGDEQRERLLQQVRRQRGLGPQRFERLVRRNAMLRRLVAGEMEVTEEDVRAAYELVFGPKVRARLIVLDSRAELDALQGRLRAVEEGREEAFALAAQRRSIDPSGAVGGLLEPFHLNDPAYPAALRRALGETEPGELTPLVDLGGRWALAMPVEQLPAAETTYEAEREELARRLRLREERRAMEALARRLVESAQVDVRDAALRWSWRSREGE